MGGIAISSGMCISFYLVAKFAKVRSSLIFCSGSIPISEVIIEVLRNYYAAYEGTAEVVDPSLLDHIDFRLVSFIQMNPTYDKLFFKVNRGRYSSIILDSGAFSVWSSNRKIEKEISEGKKPKKKKVEISFRNYLRYCKKHADKDLYFVNLDMIPPVESEEEARQKQAEVMGAANGGYKNYQRMVSALAEVGVPKERIIHVYHQFEPLEYLKRMVDEDHMDYIGLSPCNAVDTDEKRKFLGQCFDEVIGRNPPRCKTHAFGLSGFELLPEFPLYSADARSWGIQASGSSIYVPKFRSNGSRYGDPLERRWDFTKLDSYDVGNLTKKNTFWMNKQFDTRQETGSYRIRLIAYITDIDREYPFPLVDGHKLLVGESKLHVKDDCEPPGPREREIDPDSKLFKKLEELYGKIEPAQILTEEILRYGLVHNLQWRMKVNIIGMNYFVRQMDPEGYRIHLETRRP
jgi:hypothetical protein